MRIDRSVFLFLILFVFLILFHQQTEAAITKVIDDVPGITLKGWVSCNGTGIAGVVVTDGVVVTQTDDQGVYRMTRNQQATQVYISSPAGYTVPVLNSVPQFYALINRNRTIDQVDFELTKLSKDDYSHTFLAVGDPQLLRDSDVPLLRVIVQDMRDWLSVEEQNSLVHAITLGDLVFDQPKYHDASKVIFSQLNSPVYNVIGNHDHVYNAAQSAAQSNDLLADTVFKRHYGPTYYSFNRGEVHYVILDDIEYWGGSSKKYVEKLSDNQISWLAKNLSYVPKSKAIVVAVHAPTKRRSGAGISNSAQLYALLSGYANVQILSGHTHWNSVVANDGTGMTEHIVGTSCGNFWQPELYCADGTPAGYKIFHVNGTQFTWEYKTPGRSVNFQMMAYAPDANRSSVLRPQDVLVNVWDWDPSWSVEYSENEGVDYRPMIKRQMYDPYAYSIFGALGDATFPASRTWIEAVQTDHLFYFTPTIPDNIVKIRATSRFGQKYTTNVSVLKTALESRHLRNGVSVYPNPVTGGVMKLQVNGFSSGFCDIGIFNVYGIKVCSERFPVNGEMEREIQIQQLPSGFYTLKINDAYGKWDVLKFVIKN